MAVSMRHVLEHGPALRALAQTAVGVLEQRVRGGKAPAAAPTAPGEWSETELPPRSPGLIKDYIRHVGGDPAWYRGTVPAHFFPQWGFSLMGQAIAKLPYPMMRVMNAGCRIEQRAPLPAGEPLRVRSRLESIDDDGRRVILVSRIVTGTASVPEAVIADMRAFVPLGGGGNGKQSGKPDGKPAADKGGAKASVPLDAREIAFLRLRADAGLDFAKLTGDFNPIHWIPAYARASGFKACILHGFGSFALATSTIVRGLLSGDAGKLRSIEARFTRPLVMPGKMGIYVTDAGELFAGDGPGAAAYLAGRFQIGASR
jgi:acyl dehydratase